MEIAGDAVGHDLRRLLGVDAPYAEMPRVVRALRKDGVDELAERDLRAVGAVADARDVDEHVDDPIADLGLEPVRRPRAQRGPGVHGAAYDHRHARLDRPEALEEPHRDARHRSKRLLGA